MWMEFLKNEWFIWGATAGIVFAVTQGLKWLLIKPWTKKIQNTKVKKIVNILIMILAFGIAVLIEFLYSRYVMGTGLDLTRAFTGWTGSTAVYAFIERFFGKKIENPMETQEGKLVTDTVEKVVEDNSIDKKDEDAVKEFWNKVKHE